jgi:hypothetical protein
VIAFVFVSIGYTVANGAMLYLLVERLHFQYLIAQVLVSSLLGFVSYFISDWIFRDPASRAELSPRPLSIPNRNPGGTTTPPDFPE